MVAALVDHVWQSVLTLGLLALAAASARRNAAILRLWMWRIAGCKFLVPYVALSAVGGWLGYPVRFAEDTVPDYFTAPLATLAPVFSPARVAGLTGGWILVAVAGLGVALVGGSRLIHARLRAEHHRHSLELARQALDPDDGPPGLGFLRGLAFTIVAMLVLGAPVLAGAVDDRIARHALLLQDARALRDAEVTMTPAAPGMGQRARLVARADGVFIRNVSIQELAGFAYGVHRTFVWGDHFNQRGELDWLVDARYDIRIPGRIRDPDRFDSYALRVPITRMLALKHGLELYVNDQCQPPCGRYGVTIPEDSP